MRYYEHSGAVPMTGLLLMLLAAVALVPLGAIYTYVIVWIPFIYLTFLATVGFGLALGLVIGYAARLGKIRNTLVVGILGVVAAVPAYYAAWMFDPLARVGLQNGVILVDPEAVFAWVRWLYDNGAWGIRGNDLVKGPMLAGVWLIEAGVVFGVSAICAKSMVAGESFCEMCRRWTHKQEGLNQLSLIDVDRDVLEQCASGQLDALAEMPIADKSEDEFVRLDLACCPTCSECNVLSIQLVRRETDKKGNTTNKEVPLVKNFIVSDAQVATLRAAGRPRAAGTSQRDAGASQSGEGVPPGDEPTDKPTEGA